MKYLPIIISVFLSISTLCAQENLTISKHLIEARFDSSLDQEALDSIKLKLTEVNITLEYTKLEFNKKGKLKAISFKVDCNDGFSGSASQDFILGYLNSGFYRDYRPDAKSVFGTGTSGSLE